MSFSSHLQQFNQADFVPQGWFWILRSSELKAGSAKCAKFSGRDFAVYRGEDGKVRIVDAFCPHMGAHLGDGLVKGNSLRCLFHNWQFNEKGQCTYIPNQSQLGGIPKIRTYKCQERYGLIWLWTGDKDAHEEIPEVPELKGHNVRAKLGSCFTKNCHPNVVMINAIDENHFNTVHNLLVNLNMKSEVNGVHSIRFHNTTRVPTTSFLTRLIGRFYSGALTYDMTYWYGHTGTVTLGPDFLHFYIMFALRPGENGSTEGQTILLTRERSGLVGGLVNRVLLFLTSIVGNYFAKGDTVIFSKINFQLSTPVRADHAILEFIQHYEKQPAATYLHAEALRPPPELSGHA